MANQIHIAISDSKTADLVQNELAAHGIRSQRLSRDQALRFGTIFSTDKVTIQISAEEIIQLTRSAPDTVDAFFDTLERFKERIRLFVNGKPTEMPKKSVGGSVKRLTIEQFMRGESGFRR